MIFGKTDDNDFYLKINCPMSTFIAMGILMSSFDFKLASQWKNLFVLYKYFILIFIEII